MSKILDNLKQAEQDRTALADAESRLASERLGRAMAEEQRAAQVRTEEKANAALASTLLALAPLAVLAAGVATGR